MYNNVVSVMPDVIRHPEGIEKTGFRLKDCRNDRQTELFIHRCYSLRKSRNEKTGKYIAFINLQKN